MSFTVQEARAAFSFATASRWRQIKDLPKLECLPRKQRVDETPATWT
jgi:hypothetical protein